MSFGFDTALSALTAARVALNTVGHNVANAATPGYSRRRVQLGTATPETIRPGLAIGRGVTILGVERVTDAFLATRARAQQGSLGRAVAERDVLAGLERAYGEPGPGGINDALQGFFDQVRSLAFHPGDAAAQAVTTQSAKNLAQTFRAVRAAVASARGGVPEAIEAAADAANRLIDDLGRLNRSIADASSGGIVPADLLDRQDVLLDQLASYVDVTTTTTGSGQILVTAAGRAIVEPSGVRKFEVVRASTPGGGTKLRVVGSTVDVEPRTGTFRGLLDADAAVADGGVGDLDALAREFMRRVNRAHATGVPAGGGYRDLRASFSFRDADQSGSILDDPLGGQGTPFPVEAGFLTVNVTNDADGSVRQERIAVDTQTTVGQLVLSLDAVPGVTARIDAAGRLRVTGDAGYRFDFSNRVATRPDPTGALGVAVVGGGVFTGATDAAYVLRPLGAGTVGVTPGLKVAIETQDGALVGELDVGEGYSPGEALDLPQGLTIAFGAGDLDPLTGATATVRGVVDGDSSGVLAAFGVNALFAGSDARSIEVDPALLADPTRFASGRGGGGGDASNLASLLAAETALVPTFGGRTLAQKYDDVVGKAGFEAARAADAADTEAGLSDALEARRRQVSAVDVDEELLKMQEFQKTYEVAARLAQTLREITDVLMTLTG